MNANKPTLAQNIESVKPFESVYETVIDLLNAKDHHIEAEYYEHGTITAHPGFVGCFLGVDITIKINRRGKNTGVDISFSGCKSPVKRFFIRRSGKLLLKDFQCVLN